MSGITTGYITGEKYVEGEQKKLLCRFLDTAGDGTGTKNANGNYSSEADIFYIQPPSGKIYKISEMIISIVDTATFRADRYGKLGAALTNGIQVRIQNDTGTIIDLTDGIKVKANAGWARYCYDVTAYKEGAGNDYLIGRWTFEKYGQVIRLDGSLNERLEVVLNDDLTGLVEHYFMAEGFEEE